MIPTRDLIDRLAGGATPVRRLRRPGLRALAWLTLATVVLGMLIVGQGLRPDFWQCVRELQFDLAILAAIVTGICAAIAAFMLSLPDRPRRWALLPLPPLALWMSSIGYQCLTNWITFDAGGMRWGETAQCFSTLALASVPLSLSILAMIRYAAPLRPTLATLMAGLAVSALTAAAMFLIHNLDASIMILTWNVMITVVIVGLGGLLGRRMLIWAATRIGDQRG